MLFGRTMWLQQGVLLMYLTRWSYSSFRRWWSFPSIDEARISVVRTRLIFFHCAPCGEKMEPSYPKLHEPEAKVMGREAKTSSFFRNTSQAISGHATTMT